MTFSGSITNITGGVIGNAFKHGRHFRNRDNKTKIARGRLAQRNDIDALTINFDFQLIDLIVLVEHLARESSRRGGVGMALSPAPVVGSRPWESPL